MIDLKKNNYQIILAPTYELAKTIVPDASVEAEYGDLVVSGNTYTLRHHGKFSLNPAPCLMDFDEKLKSGVILISHVDLDTIGGIASIIGAKPKDDDFWKGAAYIDVNGPHHLFSLSTTVSKKLNAWFYWVSTQERVRYESITDVSEFVQRCLMVVEDIICKTNAGKELIEKGKEWYESICAQVESKLVYEDSNCRYFISDGVFCSSSYYSIKQAKIIPSIVCLNTNRRSITVSFEDGGVKYSAVDIVTSLWGPEAGGRRGIASSPRCWRINEEELMGEFIRCQNTIQNLLGKEEK